MKTQSLHQLLSLNVLIVLLTVIEAYRCKNRVCYFLNNVAFRPPPMAFHPRDLNPFLCTHIIYCLARVNGSSIVNTEIHDLSASNKKGFYHIVNEQRTANPNLKTLLAVTFTSEDFTRLESNYITRRLLIRDVVAFLRLYTFNGIEIRRAYAPLEITLSDKIFFTTLVQELSAAFNKDVAGTASDRMILAVSVSARKVVIDKAYDVKTISRYVDMLNLETARFRTGRETTVGHFGPLYGDYRVRTDTSSVDFAARYWQLLGAPKRIINIGVALSGVAYKIDKPYMHYIGSASRGPGDAGEFTNVAGTLSYFEVCQYLNSGAAVYRSRDQEVPHLVHGHEWVGFEDSQSLQAKVRYVIENQFGGLAIWSIDLDDYSGEYCGTVSYPLLAAINQACENFTFT